MNNNDKAGQEIPAPVEKRKHRRADQLPDFEQFYMQYGGKHSLYASKEELRQIWRDFKMFEVQKSLAELGRV